MATYPKRPPMKLGPGRLTFGEVGTELDMSCQVTKIAVEWSADAEDDLPTLCGGVLAGERVYTATLTGEVAQDIAQNGVIDWTWKNKGAQVKFTFTPVTANDTVKVAGECIINPLTIGGDVNKRNTSEFEFVCVGTPAFTPGPAVEDTVEVG